jgi:hypothetical protein
MATPQQKSNREHSFDAELASLVGIEKAILLKNIDYWVGENERRKIDSSFAYGKWWTFESLTSLAKKYPYMKRGNLSRWFKELKRDQSGSSCTVQPTGLICTDPARCLLHGI